MELESLKSEERKAFADHVILSWAERNTKIATIQELRDQSWTVTVPPALKIISKTHHSSLPLDIASRVPGVLTLREPVWFRTAPDEDAKSAERANTVSRYFMARHAGEKRHGIPGKNAHYFTTDQLVNKGGACIGVLFAPHLWAASPTLSDGKGKPMPKWWRDKRGKAVDEESAADARATAKAYNDAVDAYRRRALPPITRRYLPTEQCYPAFVGNQMAAMVIKRKTTPLELQTQGFEVGSYVGESAKALVEKEMEVTELWLPNSYHYFYAEDELTHRDGNEDGGVLTRYGFVPYSYQAGLEGGDLEYGSYGLPLLALVESNIKMIDALLTFRQCAIHLASFTTFQLIHKVNSESALAVSLTANAEPQVYTIEPGTIMDFHGDAVVEPLVHPGLNKDFDKALAEERAEVRRIIPDVMIGKGGVSGYQDAILSQQSMALFNGIQEAADILLENASILEMHHISDRVPGPIYVDYAERTDEHSRRPDRVSRISIEKADIDDYYAVTVNTERAVDIITQGTFAVQTHAAGHMNRKWVHKMVGGTDYEASEKQRRIEEFMARQDVKDILAARAIHDAGLDNLVAEAAAEAQIQVGPDGTPLVQTPNGPVGPGAGLVPGQSTISFKSAPSPAQLLQGPTGAMLGGANLNSPGPNMASTHNPAITQPTPQQPDRLARRGGLGARGGANAGAPQRQGATKPGVMP